MKISQRKTAAHDLCLAIAACDPEDASVILSGVLDRMRAGRPIPPFEGLMQEAIRWADVAMPNELEAYCLASFNRMAAHRQADFLTFVQGRAAA